MKRSRSPHEKVLVPVYLFITGNMPVVISEIGCASASSTYSSSPLSTVTKNCLVSGIMDVSGGISVAGNQQP